jgi:hypothetical protein
MTIVQSCVRNELARREEDSEGEELVEKVVDQLTYWPSDLKLFSTSGCKRVAQKVKVSYS